MVLDKRIYFDNITVYVDMVQGCIMVLLLTWTLYTMVVARRRKEWFFILTPLFFVISSTSGLVNNLLSNFGGNHGEGWNKQLDCISR